MDSDLDDLRYLYRYGEYVSSNETGVAMFLAGLSQDEIDSMARTYTEGYRIGFINGRKDISKKKTVNIRYNLGFERNGEGGRPSVPSDGAGAGDLTVTPPMR